MAKHAHLRIILESVVCLTLEETELGFVLCGVELGQFSPRSVGWSQVDGAYPDRRLRASNYRPPGSNRHDRGLL